MNRKDPDSSELSRLAFALEEYLPQVVEVLRAAAAGQQAKTRRDNTEGYDPTRLLAERDKYLDAIRRHRDYRGDDRCWRDDEELYQALPEGHTPKAREVAVELANCERFCQSRQHPLTVYVSPQRRIDELEALLAAESALHEETDRKAEVFCHALWKIFEYQVAWAKGKTLQDAFDDMVEIARVALREEEP